MDQVRDELMHYGVLGMKWGRATKGDSYVYKSHSTKKWEKRSDRAQSQADFETNARNKATAKGKASQGNLDKSKAYSDKMQAVANAAKEKAKNSAAHDKEMQKFADGMSTGKAIAGALIFGTSGMKSYGSLKASGYSTVDAAVGTSLAGPLGAAYVKHLRINGQQG